MGTVCAQTDRHSVSCIVMQRAENVPDAFFRFILGKTSLFAVFAAESRSAVLAVRVTSPYTTRPTPRSFPFRTAIATDAPNSGDRTANHFAVFVPQPFRVIDKLAVRESHEVRTYTNFTSFRLSCGLRRSKKPRNGGNFRDRMCNCNTVTRDAITIAIWSGLRPDTPPTPHGPRKNSAYRSPFPNSSNRKSRGPAPLAWVPIL